MSHPLAAAPAHPAITARAVHLIVVGAALVLWAVALGGVDLARMSGYGLLSALPVAWWLSVALLTGGFAVAAASGRPRPLVLGAYVVALVVVLTATTAIVYDAPRYAWTYKHLGVIDAIGRTGAMDRSVDIYQNWPGFFALNAWLEKTAGLDAMRYAGWAQLFFGLANVSAVLFALRGVTRDVALQWTAAWLFVVCNWIGQDYLAPQAFTFFLAMVVLGLVIRCAPWARPPRTRVGWALVQTVNRVARRLLRGRPPRPREVVAAPVGPRAALALGTLCYLAVVISHQLSGVMVILGVTGLVLAGRRPPLWILAGLVAIEVWWVSLSYDFVTQHFRLLDFNPSASARPTGYDLQHGLAGVKVGADASRAVILGVFLLAVAGLVRRLRAGNVDLTPAILVAAPVSLLAFQSYGGEGPLRVYLFALPWLAFFMAAAVRPLARSRGPALRAAPLVLATGVLGAGALLGLFGQETVNRMTPDDVAASRWFYDHAPPGAELGLAAPNFPERVDANYVDHLDELPALVQDPGALARLRDPRPRFGGACDADCVLRSDVERLLGRGGARARYFTITPSQLAYARYYSVAPRAAFGRLERALASAPEFPVVFRRGQAVVFRYDPSAAPACRPNGGLVCTPAAAQPGS